MKAGGARAGSFGKDQAAPKTAAISLLYRAAIAALCVS